MSDIVGEAMITDLDFVDDVAIFAETLEVQVGALDSLSTESEPVDLAETPKAGAQPWPPRYATSAIAPTISSSTSR